MSRVKRGVTTHARHKKILAMASGYQGRNRTAFRVAIERVEKGLRVLYDFQNTDGAMVMDRSGVDKPLNLRITNTKSVRRANGA